MLCLCECVGSHVVGQAVDKADRASFNDVTNKMKTNINMFCSGVVLVIFHELDCGLVVRKKSH